MLPCGFLSFFVLVSAAAAAESDVRSVRFLLGDCAGRIYSDSFSARSRLDCSRSCAGNSTCQHFWFEAGLCSWIQDAGVGYRKYHTSRQPCGDGDQQCVIAVAIYDFGDEACMAMSTKYSEASKYINFDAITSKCLRFQKKQAMKDGITGAQILKYEDRLCVGSQPDCRLVDCGFVCVTNFVPVYQNDIKSDYYCAYYRNEELCTYEDTDKVPEGWGKENCPVVKGWLVSNGVSPIKLKEWRATEH